MRTLINVAYLAVWLYTLVLFARIILSYVMTMSRDWKPRGAGLVAAELVFTLTDPPVKALRKLVPPLPLGRVRLDLSVTITIVVCWILQTFLRSI